MNKQTIQVVVLIVLGLGALVYFVGMPMYEQYGQFEVDIKEMAVKLDDALEKQKNLPELERTVKEMEKELGIAEKKLPSGENYSVLLTQVPRVFYNVGVSRDNLTNISWGNPRSLGMYSEVPLFLQINNIKFEHFIEVLYKLDIFERLLDITTLNLTVSEPDKNILNIGSMEIKIYIFDEEREGN